MNQKKIAIVGMGVAGSYLINQLTKLGHYVEGFERYTFENFECACAWGTSAHGMKKFVTNCGLDFDDYTIHMGKNLSLEYGQNKIVVDTAGLVTFDKHQLVLDMQKDCSIHYGEWKKEIQGDYDIIIDATGNTRALLPKMNEPDLQIPVVQYRVKFDKPPFDDFTLKMFETNSGYFWYFPLGNNEAHIGAGDYFKHHLDRINEFLIEYKPTLIKKVGKPVRLRPPSKCEPFFYENIVGVGESIGTVFPLAGEGIIPSLQCADLFLQNIEDWKKYRKQVLQHFAVFDEAGELLVNMLKGNISIPADLIRLMNVGNHLVQNQERYGISVNPSMFKIDLASILKSGMNISIDI